MIKEKEKRRIQRELRSTPRLDSLNASTSSVLNLLGPKVPLVDPCPTSSSFDQDQQTNLLPLLLPLQHHPPVLPKQATPSSS